jgi:hypothetical protein
MAIFLVEHSNMHRFRSGIAGMVLVGLVAGCGGSTVDEGPKPFAPTDTTQLQNSMVKELQDGMKKKDYINKPSSPPEKSKVPDKKK